MFPREGELFIAATFKRVARDKFKVSASELDRVFEEALRTGLIKYVRKAGIFPGIEAYEVGETNGEILASIDPNKK